MDNSDCPWEHRVFHFLPRMNQVQVSHNLHKGKVYYKNTSRRISHHHHCHHHRHHHPGKAQLKRNMQGLKFIITTQLCTFFCSWFQQSLTTAFLPTIGKKKPILLPQDNLPFRFKNFAPSGQLVKLAGSSQIASQGCVPSLSPSFPGSWLQTPTWWGWGPGFRPALQALPGLLGCLTPLFCMLAWFCWRDWWKSAAPILAESSTVGLTQSILCPLHPDTGCPSPAVTAPPQLSKDC